MSSDARGGDGRSTELLVDPVEASFRGLLEVAPDAMLLVAADGRIQLVNGHVERLFGYARDELIGQPIELLVPARFRAAHPAYRAGYFHDPGTRPMGAGLELFGLHKDGSEFPAEISLAPVQSPDGPLAIAAIRDVSERRRMQQRIQEASRLKSEFLANMSHELRTPLNAIIGFAELMHKGKVGPMAEEHREYLGDILTSSRHLLQLINDVLDLAKVEAGKVEFHPEPVDLAQLVAEVRDVLRGLAADKRQRIAAEVELGTAVVDPSRLKQVLYNYLSNAIKFTPEGGRITVRIAAESEELFRLDVEDDGIGIAPEDLGRLFVEFQQLDASSAKQYQGTGLGLALTKQIVEAHGGRVAVHSTVGRGSTFSAVLPRRPLVRQPELAAASALPRVAALAGRSILVLDDDATALRLAEAELRQLGARPVCVRSGDEALRRAEHDPPALVIVDLAMPGMDGLGFIARLRDAEASARVPIIVWTARDLSAGERAQLQASTQAIVPKGGGGGALVAELRRFLRPEEPPDGG